MTISAAGVLAVVLLAGALCCTGTQFVENSAIPKYL